MLAGRRPVADLHTDVGFAELVNDGVARYRSYVASLTPEQRAALAREAEELAGEDGTGLAAAHRPGVRPVTGGPGVGAGAAVDHPVAGAVEGPDDVAAGVAVEPVGTRATDHRVVAGAAAHDVRPVGALQDVVAGPAPRSRPDPACRAARRCPRCP